VCLTKAATSIPADRIAILGAIAQELTRHRGVLVRSLSDVAERLSAAVLAAVARAGRAANLAEALYLAMDATRKVYRGDVPLDAPDRAAIASMAARWREVVAVHFLEGPTKMCVNKDSGPELEVWETLTALHRAFERGAPEGERPWVDELRRLSRLLLSSYSARFSAAYVEKLMLDAGALGDVTTMRTYVNAACHGR